MSTKAYDAVVIGGGVIGTSVAYYLARERLRVALVERGTLLSGTTAACDGGIILQTKQPGIHLDLARASAALFPRLAEELERPIEYTAVSAMLTLTSEASREPMLRFVARQREAGLNVRLLDPAEVRDLEPAMCGELLGATYLEPTDGVTDGMVNPPYLGFAFATAARRLGAEIFGGEPVVGIDLQGGRVAAVRTPRRRLACGLVVNACGAWAPEVGRMVGLELPIRPRRGQIVVTECLPPLVGRFVVDATYVALKYNPDLLATRPAAELPVPLALEQTKAGSFLLGSTREFVGFDRRTWPSALARIVQAARRLIPALGRVQVVRSFAGLRPATPDGLPILGQSAAVPGFYVAAGHEGDGISLSAITGQLVAELVAGRPTSLPLEALRPERFAGLGSCAVLSSLDEPGTAGT